MSLDDILFRLELSQYGPKLSAETIDLHALTLLGPVDIRMVIGMPLGLAAKLIHFAQDSFAERHVAGTPTSPQSDESIVHRGSAGTSTAIPQSQTSMLHGDVTSIPKPPDKMDAEGELRGLLEADDSELLRGYCSVCWSTLCNVLGSACKAGTCVPDMLIPVDMQMNFMRHALVAKSGAGLKNCVMNMSNNWILVMGFFYQGTVSIWNLFPADAEVSERLLYEGVVSMCAVVQLLVMCGFCALSNCTEAVSFSNAKAFVAGALGSINVLLKCWLFGAHLLIAALVICSYSRMKTIMNSSAELRMLSWPYAFRCAVCLAVVAYFLLVLGLVFSFGRLVHNGCLMSESTRTAAFTSAAKMEETLSDEAWRRVQNFPDSHAPVEYAFKSKMVGSIVPSREANTIGLGLRRMKLSI